MVRFCRGFFLLSLFTIHFSLLLAGCAPSPRVSLPPSFAPAPELGNVYVVPFVTTLVPETFGEQAFNDFVDRLNAGRRQTGASRFLILKEELKDVDPAWLARQPYISGEIWSYIENSGCCQTELRVKARVYLFESGKKEPSVEIFVPLESFFDHDRSTLEAERNRLAHRLAAELADRIIGALARGR